MIRDAGFDLGRDVAPSVDVAATHFYDSDGGGYLLEDETLSPAEIAGRVIPLTDQYPLLFVEDSFAEDDWDAWTGLVEGAPADLQILGDDVVVTNEDRLERATASGLRTRSS